MRVTTEEILRPDEWLRKVLTDPEAFARLVYQSEGLATAAYRLAQAQCRATELYPRPPTLAELKLAAQMIAGRTGASPRLPIESARGYRPAVHSWPAVPAPPSQRRRAAV